MAMAWDYCRPIIRTRFSLHFLKRNIGRVSGTDRPWLVDASPPPNFKFNATDDKTSTGSQENPDGSEFSVNSQAFSSHDDDDDDLQKLCRIVRNNGEEMEATLASSNIHFTAELIEELMERTEYSWKPLLRVFQWVAKRPGFVHSSRACNHLLNSMCRMREFDSAWLLVAEMKNHGLPNLETFSILFRRYARVGMTSAALRTFDLMEYFGLQADCEAFISLLDALCKEKKAQAATAIFKKRKSRFCSTVVMYNILINGWCRTLRVGNAHKLFDEMINSGLSPTVVTFTTLINGYCTVKRVDDAFHLLKIMKEHGCEPNIITYNSIVDALGEARRFQDAFSMLEEMDAAGCEPNIATYNSFVKGFCKHGDLPGASGVLKSMMEKGCLPTCQTYSYFFKYFSKYGKIREAMELYMKMIDGGYAIERLTYQLLIKMLCEKRRVDLALQVKKDMELRGCDPDLATCTMLIHRLCRAKRLEDACEHFEKMISRGLSPQYITFRMLTDCLNESKQFGRAQILADLMKFSPHYTKIPKTYRRNEDYGKKEVVDAIMTKAQKLSTQLSSHKNRKLHAAWDDEQINDSSEDIMEAAFKFMKMIKDRAADNK